MMRRYFPHPINTVAIDARAISHPQAGGFKTYSVNLVNHLVDVDNSLNYVLLMDRPGVNALGPLPRKVSIRIIPSAVLLGGVPFRENVALPFHLRNDTEIDLLHFPNASAALWSPRPFVITIHDAMELMAMSRQFGGASIKRNLMHLYNRLNQLIAVRQAEAIITVSECSKRDIAHYLHVSGKNIFVTYAAPDEAFTCIRDAGQLLQARQKYGLEPKYILGIGSADPRKNIGSLIRAFRQLPSELISSYQLAIVLTHQRFEERLYGQAKELGIAERVQFLKSVPTADLVRIYSAASLFVFPSLYEGFGLPPLEAMACGVPVVAANNSSLSEILGAATQFVNDVNPAGDLFELTQTMRLVLESPAIQRSMSQYGLARVRAFSWDRCARETLDVYNRVLEQRRFTQLPRNRARQN